MPHSQRFGLCGAPGVLRVPTCLRNLFTFTSFRRLSCRSTSNAVYHSALGILHFEWSDHEMMQGERCQLNLNGDVCVGAACCGAHCPFAFRARLCTCVPMAVLCSAVFASLLLASAFVRIPKLIRCRCTGFSYMVHHPDVWFRDPRGSQVRFELHPKSSRGFER